MSFGQPPPMSRYGDKDFIKEDLDPNQSQKSPLYTTQAYSPADHDPNAPPVQRPVKMSNLSGQIARSEITEEDRLFMKSWREDCFYYRAVPITAFFSGLMYWFNKSKGRPNKLSHYLFLPVPCYFLGITFYSADLRRRLEQTPLDTPFIQSLRDMTGTKSTRTLAGFGGDQTMQDFTEPFDAGNWGADSSQSQPPRASAYNRPSAYGNTQYPSYDADVNQGGNQGGMDESRSAVNYDELRARNRGMIPK